MKVSLFVTCLVDQLWTSVGVSSVEVLRRVGCEVEFDKRQTCCAQPAFNTGYLDEARAVARRFISIFEESKADAIVSPSGSCTAMVHHYPQLFAGDSAWLNGRLTWHDACHGLRDLNIKTEPRTLIRNVRGAEFVELEHADACCGFGGTFSVKYPEISVAILDQKIEAIERAGVQAVVSGDASCLMQIGGRLSRKGSKVRVMHLAELLSHR